MERYRFAIQLDVEVEAFSKEDAKDLLEDAYAPGEEYGITIVKLAVKDAK